MSAASNPAGTLIQATHRAVEAVAAGDLESLDEALRARAAALPCTSPEECAAAAGQGAVALALLRSLRNRIALEKHLLERHMEQARGDGLDFRLSALDLRG